jgi:hypothetical protein
MASSNFICRGPKNLPDPAIFPIPRDINFALAPLTNASEPWMIGCCSPNPVSVINKCYMWCEIPESRVYKTDGQTKSDFSECFNYNARTSSNVSTALYVKATMSTGGKRGLSVKGMAWGLMAVGMVGFTL